MTLCRKSEVFLPAVRCSCKGREALARGLEILMRKSSCEAYRCSRLEQVLRRDLSLSLYELACIGRWASSQLCRAMLRSLFDLYSLSVVYSLLVLPCFW